MLSDCCRSPCPCCMNIGCPGPADEDAWRPGSRFWEAEAEGRAVSEVLCRRLNNEEVEGADGAMAAAGGPTVLSAGVIIRFPESKKGTQDGLAAYIYASQLSAFA